MLIRFSRMGTFSQIGDRTTMILRQMIFTDGVTVKNLKRGDLAAKVRKTFRILLLIPVPKKSEEE
jgi:hypothetical protein